MWIAFFLNYCDRQVVSSLFPLLQRDLHFTNVQLGLTVSIFLWVYGLMSPIAGQVGDTYSKRMLVIVSLIAWSAATLLTGFSNSPTMLLALRGVIGVTEAFFFPAAIALIANAHAPSTRSRALAVFGTAQIAGIIGGGWFGGYMAEGFHWRLSFVVLGMAGIIYAIPYFVFLRNVSEESAVETKKSGSQLAVKALVCVPTYCVLCVAFPAFVFVTWLLSGWLTTFFHEKFSLGLKDAALAATLYQQGATIVGVLTGGVLADWLFKRTPAARFWLVGAGLFLCAPCVHFMGNSDLLLQTKIAAAAFGLTSGLVIANIMPSSFDVVPADTRASAVGVLNLMGGLVAGVGTWLGGKLKETVGIDKLLTLSAVMCVVAGVLVAVAIKFLFQRDYDRVH